MNKPRRATDAADLDWRLQYFRKMAVMHGPSFAWLAIRECTRHKVPLPPWVIEYLGQCAERWPCMMDPEDKAAKRARSGKAIDSREELLRILGFPPQKKRGPGSRIDPSEVIRKALLKRAFASKFALLLKKGESPVQARYNAGLLWFGKDMDDRTLRKCLREEFQVPANQPLPASRQEWEPAIYAYWSQTELGPALQKVEAYLIHKRQKMIDQFHLFASDDGVAS
jgi:hypothetical protein